MKYEFGIMSTAYTLEADDKRIAYCAMIAHYQDNPNMIVIYAPEEAKADSWTSFFDDSIQKLDKAFGGPGEWEKFLSENIKAIKACMKTIKKKV